MFTPLIILIYAVVNEYNVNKIFKLEAKTFRTSLITLFICLFFINGRYVEFLIKEVSLPKNELLTYTGQIVEDSNRVPGNETSSFSVKNNKMKDNTLWFSFNYYNRPTDIDRNLRRFQMPVNEEVTVYYIQGESIGRNKSIETLAPDDQDYYNVVYEVRSKDKDKVYIDYQSQRDYLVEYQKKVFLATVVYPLLIFLSAVLGLYWIIQKTRID